MEPNETHHHQHYFTTTNTVTTTPSTTNGLFLHNESGGSHNMLYPHSVPSAVTLPLEPARRKRGRPRKYGTPEQAMAAKKTATLSSKERREQQQLQQLALGGNSGSLSGSSKKSQFALGGCLFIKKDYFLLVLFMNLMVLGGFIANLLKNERVWVHCFGNRRLCFLLCGGLFLKYFTFGTLSLWKLRSFFSHKILFWEWEGLMHCMWIYCLFLFFGWISDKKYYFFCSIFVNLWKLGTFWVYCVWNVANLFELRRFLGLFFHDCRFVRIEMDAYS